MAHKSMYYPIWERLKKHKRAVITFPASELNLAVAVRRTRKGVIKLKDNDKAFKATSEFVFYLRISTDMKARTLTFELMPSFKELKACQL